jgi:hypothetical protein
MAPFGGMTAMYGLMSVFHASPWLRLISARYTILRLTYRNQN